MPADITWKPGTHQRRPLYHWVADCLSDENKAGKVNRITLLHAIREDHHVEVYSFTKAPFEAKAIGELLEAKAEFHAQDLPGPQQFVIAVCWDDSPSPQAHHPFTVNRSIAGTGFVETGESRNAMIQQQKILAETTKHMLEQSSSLFRLQNETTAPLYRHYSELMHENRAMFETMKELMISMHDKRHEQRKDELKYVRDTEERRKWISFIPLLANTLLGREVFPQNSADSAILDAAADNLSPEEVMMLATKIPPELMGPLSARNEKYLAEKRQREEATQAALAYETPMLAAQDELEMEEGDHAASVQ
jgi:hypothetical protein